MTKVLISSNPEKLAEALKLFDKTATVEAEYGDVLVSGTALTLAHHGTRSANPAPCLFLNEGGVEVDAIGISHFDLDSLGGLASILRHPCSYEQPANRKFWQAAGFVDVNGSHRAEDFPGWQEVAPLMNAFWAWSEKNRLFPVRDGSVTDVTTKINEALEMVSRILNGDPELLAAGEAWQAEAANDEKRCFISDEDHVRVFAGDTFCNCFYRRPNGTVAKGIVTYNTITGSITVSFEDGGKAVSARQIVQNLWGKEAGGHDGIAGSPRNRRMTFYDFRNAVNETRLALNEVP
jgi:hypothetical protein